MNRLVRFAISVVGSVVVALGMWALPAWGQAENPPAKTKASGKTSGKGQTAVEQTTKGYEASVTGCLAGPNDQGAYTLTTEHYKKGVDVSGEEGVDLNAHVGHTVKLTGMWVKSGAAVGEKEKAEEKGKRHFKATAVDHVAPTCTQTGKAAPK